MPVVDGVKSLCQNAEIARIPLYRMGHVAKTEIPKAADLRTLSKENALW
jgi:hypothetical protein